MYAKRRRANVDQVPINFDLQAKRTYTTSEDAREGDVAVTTCHVGARKRAATLQIALNADPNSRQPHIAIIFKGKGGAAKAPTNMLHHPNLTITILSIIIVIL